MALGGGDIRGETDKTTFWAGIKHQSCRASRYAQFEFEISVRVSWEKYSSFVNKLYSEHKNMVPRQTNYIPLFVNINICLGQQAIFFSTAKKKNACQQTNCILLKNIVRLLTNCIFMLSHRIRFVDKLYFYA